MQRKNSNLTQERLKEVLSYDPSTGDFIWLITRGRNAPAGTKASQSVNSQGYRQIMIDQQHFKAHRLVWFYVYGVWPEADIDHINGVRSDNRIINLRALSRSDNVMNSPRKCGTYTSRYRGVHYHKPVQKWVAKYKGKYLGAFDTEEEAHEAYLTEARKHIRLLPLHPAAERIAQL